MKYVILFVIIVILLLVCRMAYESFLELSVRREKLTTREDAVRIVHISDIHKRRFGKNNIRLSMRTKALRPDVIFVTGDSVSRTENDFSAVSAFLRELINIAPVYVIIGNHEQSLPPPLDREFTETVKRTGAVLLQNEITTAEIKGRKLNICGYDAVYTTYKKNNGYKDLDKVTSDDIRRALGNAPEGEVMLLVHNPFFAKAYAEWGADCSFSGHVHGGVVRLFGAGLLSPERRFFPKYSKGVYLIDGMKLCVSAGLGKLRLFDPPEIVLYEV